MPHNLVDWSQVLGAFVGVIGIGIAVYAAIKANHAQVQAQKALVRERRIDFQLDQLMELARNNLMDSNVALSTEHFQMAASLLPAELVPIARSVVRLPSTPQADDYVRTRLKVAHDTDQRGTRDFLRREIIEEIKHASASLLADRDELGQPGWLSRQWGRLLNAVHKDLRNESALTG